MKKTLITLLALAIAVPAMAKTCYCYYGANIPEEKIGNDIPCTEAGVSGIPTCKQICKKRGGSPICK